MGYSGLKQDKVKGYVDKILVGSNFERKKVMRLIRKLNFRIYDFKERLIFPVHKSQKIFR